MKDKTSKFIEKARKIHGDKYDYSKVEYVNNRTKVCIICPEHGEFWQMPSSHLNGHGCQKCNIKKLSVLNNKTLEEFVEEAKKVHGDKYDYSKVVFHKMHEKVCIICPIHGEFWQTPKNHIKGHGCQKCRNEYIKHALSGNIEGFLQKAKKIHGDKYDYSKVEYVNNKTKVCIICHEKDENGIEHGEFWQTPGNHLNGWGCSKCSQQYHLNDAEYINKAKKIYGDKYDYSKVRYVNNKTKIVIGCPIHGEYSIYPIAHLKGQECKYCTMPTLEKEIKNALDELNICYIHQASKKDGLAWLNNQSLDFYLPDQNIAIECQGEQHYRPFTWFGGLDKFNDRVKLDNIKNEKCKKHNITLLYYTKNNFIKNNILDNTFTDINDIISIIKK